MKLVELRCPACNGTVKLDPEHPGEAVCEYCKTRYMVEKEAGDEYRLGNFGAGRVPDLRPRGGLETAYDLNRKQQAAKKDIRMAIFLSSCVACLALIFGVLFLVKGGGSKGASGKTLAVRQETQKAAAAETSAGTSAKAIKWSKGMERVVYAVYGRLPDQVDDREFEKLRYLVLTQGVWEMEKDRRYFRVEYGLDGDLGPDGEMIIHTYEEDYPAGVTSGRELFGDFSCMQKFKGLETLNLGSGVKPGDLSGLENIKTLGVQYMTPKEAAELLDKPANLKKLIYHCSQPSLEGIGVFSSLESLELDGSDDLADIKDLASLKSLKSLSLEYCPSLTDFSVLFVLTGLEELRLDVDGVKDISFVNSMPGLRSFSLDDGSCISIDALASCENLRELSLVDNYELPDYRAITGLTGLERLTLEKYTTQPDPDLSGMSQVKYLQVSGFDSCSFLRSMPGLEELTIAGYGIDDPGAFSALTQLKRLKGTKSWEYLNDVSFLAKLPALTELDLSGTTFYTDISPLFNKEGLEILNLNGSSAEINFSRLKDNPALSELSMDGMKLYKNVQVARYGGISQVNWDDVSLDAELGFLAHYPGLVSLSLADNKLSKIQPVAALSQLERLDISENYVTDVTPLSALERLTWLDGRENPVSNWQAVGEKTTVIK